MTKGTILYEFTPEQIQSLFDGLNTRLNQIEKNLQPKQPAEYLTRSEVRDLLKCDLSTIHNWCKKGKLKPFGIGSRVYFLRSDIEAVLIPLGKNKDDENI